MTTLSPPQNDVSEELIVRQAQVLKMAKCSRSTLERWIAAGDFPGPIEEWPGKFRVWSRATLTEFFDRMTKPAAPE